METTGREDAGCNHSHSTDTPVDEAHPRQDDDQPHPVDLPDSIDDQQPQGDPTAISCDFPFSLPTSTSSPTASHDAHSESTAASDKLAAIRSPPHDVVSDTPNSGSDEEDSRVSLPNHDVDEDFSLKLSTEGSDTASTRLSVEPEAVPVVGEKSAAAAAVEKSVVSQVSVELESKAEDVSTSCVMTSESAEQDEVPATRHIGSDQGSYIQADASSLHGKDQLSETMLSTRKDTMVADGGDQMEDNPALSTASCDKSEDSSSEKQLNTRSSSSRTLKKRVSETKVSSPVRKYITRKSVASSSTSSLASPVRQSCPPANEQPCEDQYALPMEQSQGNEDMVKKPLAALADSDEAEHQTALLVPSTNSLTIITSTYSMSATFIPDTPPSNTLPTTTSSISTISTAPATVALPNTSTPSGQETKLLAKRGRGRPRKHPLVQRDGLSKEKADRADSRNQSSLGGNVKPDRQKHDGQTAVNQEVTGEDVRGKDAKKPKMSDSSDDKQTERRRSLRERVRTPLLEESGLFTPKRKPRKSSSSCSTGRGPESATAKSSKDVHPKKGSNGLSRAGSSSQQISPTSQTRGPRRNSSRSYARSPRKKQASRRSDEGVLPIHRNWLCALCNHGNSCNGLGYLYGPYRCHETSEHSADKSSPEKEMQNELWVHMDCAVWTSGICLVGSELKGLEQAVEEGRKSVCNACDKPGATIRCVQDRCFQRFHLPCASSKGGCRFEQEQYHFYCPVHA